MLVIEVSSFALEVLGAIPKRPSKDWLKRRLCAFGTSNVPYQKSPTALSRLSRRTGHRWVQSDYEVERCVRQS